MRLYAGTVRHLRPVQIYGRLWFHAARPRPDLRPQPGLRQHNGWVSPARRGQSQIGPDEFRFLNETRSLSQSGWDDPAVAKLWLYNLHYFDDLNAEEAERRTDWHRALIARWTDQNPPGKGTGWEPYPTSLRIVNWIKWALAGNALSPETVASLAIQARWLVRRLERHLLGNHLFANAKALVFAGCFFAGEEAGAWLDLGLSILAREVPEQILEDGGHFELSTMYHALALEDLLDLVNVMRAAGLSVPDLWEGKIAAMRSWLAAMSHPDGEIGFFNDAALGIAPSPAELEAYAGRLRFVPAAAASLRWLQDSGYVRLGDDRAVALLDVGRVGPDYLPGHAHADTLSFELSVNGRRVIVNSGTSVYGNGPERLRQRGTAGHNTVEIDGENSSEVWSGFRVARRACPEGLFVTMHDEFSIVACSHDGYRRLSGRPCHRRSWYFGGDTLIVSDKVEGGHGRAVAAFHFHPACTLSASADGSTGTLPSHTTPCCVGPSQRERRQ
ncbi:heparinase [Mesorhizobium soli]|uniref:Heparinase n=1 Tax=Pseudaminobacter soli (ex Li et al. 2025) TaxID=1295366 RepID=A0A2P7SGK6_9HYPH|nr:heparinase [Mesorhizobium soli]